MTAAMGRAGGCNPAAPGGGLDAELLRLGSHLTNAWAIENAAWSAADGEDDEGPRTAEAQALMEATGVIVARIQRERAMTLDGLRVKMRAVLWCRAGDPVSVKDISFSKPPGIDMAMLAGLIADLTAMGAPA